MKYAALLVRCALGGIFVYAGIVKLRSPGSFAANIAAFALLPSSAVDAVAASLPAFEILLGLLLLSGWLRRAAAFSAIVLAALLAATLGSAIARGLVIDCGCFGAAPPSATGMWLSLARDLILLAAAGWLYLFEGTGRWR